MAAVCEVCGKKPLVGHECEPLAPPHQAPLEPQHPTRARPRRTGRPSVSMPARAASSPARSRRSCTSPRPLPVPPAAHPSTTTAVAARRPPLRVPRSVLRPPRKVCIATATGVVVLRAPQLRLAHPIVANPRSSMRGSPSVQGVVKSYDPGSGDGILVRDTDLSEVDLAADALSGSVFRLLRQGQRVIFDLNGEGQATHLRLGSEVDMGTPGLDPERGAPPGVDAASD